MDYKKCYLKQKELISLLDDCNFSTMVSKSEWLKREQLYNELAALESEEDKTEVYEPYFGWCDVSGCKNEGCNGGGCWRETGYWTVCSKHCASYRAGDPQPKMKRDAIKREKGRDKVTGFLKKGFL